MIVWLRIVRALWNAVHDAPTSIIPEHPRPAHLRYTVRFTINDSKTPRLCRRRRHKYHRARFLCCGRYAG